MSSDAGTQQQSVADALARLVEARRGAESAWVEALRELGAVDRAVYEAVADTPTPALDGPVRKLSNAASYSRLWLGVAAVLAVLGGRRGRRAALEGVLAIGVTSATVNLGMKPLAQRERPDRAGHAAFAARRVPMPESDSFPSGHAASAFAFATATYSVTASTSWPTG
jgi:PAP2 superfamily